MFKNILLFIFLQSTLLYSMSEETPMIGDTVEIVEQDEFQKDFAFVGSIGEYSKCGVHKKFKGHYCGGTLISERHVLTAAHCLKITHFYWTMVTFGSTDLNRGWSYEIESWIDYKTWAFMNGQNYSNVRLYDDIAVITLSRAVTHIKPAEISKLSDDDVIGEKVVALGWGFADRNGILRPTKMQKAYMDVLKPNDCNKKLSKALGRPIIIQDSHYCTDANPPVLMGYGDSGGPILTNSTKELVGIVSSNIFVQ